MINITAQDILNRWVDGDAPDKDDNVFNTILEDAIVLVKTKFPTLEERITEGTININIVKMVLAAVIQRFWNDGASQKSSYSYSTGPFSESGSFSDTSKKGLYFTAEEISLLKAQNSFGRAFTLNLDAGNHSNFPILNPKRKNWNNYLNNWED